MRRLAVALLAGASFVSAASAADIPARMPAKAPAYQPVPFTWTGFYAGLNAGWAWTHVDGTSTFAGAPATFGGNTNGFVGGGQTGYNWQMGSFVAGLETDFQGSTNQGAVTTNAAAFTDNATYKMPWFGTVRGRLGYAANDWLFYVTGGGLYGNNTLSGTLPTGPYSASSTFWTYAVGGGIEKMLWSRWSAKIEYLYASKPGNYPTPPGVSNVSVNSNTNIVRLGINYHF